MRNLTSFGAFVEIEPGIDGLVHISDMSWTKRVEHPSDVVKKGDTVDVVILNIDGESKRISLGLKQAQEDPWLKIGEEYPVGRELTGSVVRYQDDGIVVDIGNDIEGFVPPTQLPLSPEQSLEDAVKPGQGVEVKVIEVDPIHHKIILAATEFLAQPSEVAETRPEEPGARTEQGEDRAGEPETVAEPPAAQAEESSGEEKEPEAEQAEPAEQEETESKAE